MVKALLQRLGGYLRNLLYATGKTDPPAGEGSGAGRWPELTVIEGGKETESGKGTSERDGNERKKPCAVIGIPYSSDTAENTETKDEEDVMNTIAKYMFTTVAVAAAAMILAA